MMNFQGIIVIAFVTAAAFYVAFMIYKKTRSMSKGSSACADDCGCSSTAKKPRIAA